MQARTLVLRFGWSVLAYAGVFAAGVLLLNGSTDVAFDLLVAVVITLVLISLRNTWDLLISVGEATMGHADRG